MKEKYSRSWENTSGALIHDEGHWKVSFEPSWAMWIRQGKGGVPGRGNGKFKCPAEEAGPRACAASHDCPHPKWNLGQCIKTIEVGFKPASSICSLFFWPKTCLCLIYILFLVIKQGQRKDEAAYTSDVKEWFAISVAHPQVERSLEDLFLWLAELTNAHVLSVYNLSLAWNLPQWNNTCSFHLFSSHELQLFLCCYFSQVINTLIYFVLTAWC